LAGWLDGWLALSGVANQPTSQPANFCHYERSWLGSLYDHTIAWARNQGATSIHTTCAQGDVLKPAALESLGFRRSEQTRRLNVYGETLEIGLFQWD
jgi:hypothetical protein